MFVYQAARINTKKETKRKTEGKVGVWEKWGQHYE